MRRVCIDLDTGKMIESQSGSGRLDVLLQNAKNAGYAEDQVEVKEVSEKEFIDLLDAAKDPYAEIKAQLSATDNDTIRVLEDLIDLLEADGHNIKSRLPQEAVNKLYNRQTLRSRL